MRFNFRKIDPVLRVRSFQRKTVGRYNRVSAEIDGLPIWFESSDNEIVASPEAYGSFLLIPALHYGRTLAMDEPVCDVWAKNIEAISLITSDWWGYGPASLELKTRTVDAPRAAGTALCFSGGVDSFYTLLCGPRSVDTLVYAIGYDVKLNDAKRLAAVDRSVRAVAAEFGARTIVIATNLRSHPAFRSVQWERSHGGALVALGHLLATDTGRLEISSSHPFVDNQPWGSHWDIDPHFSSAWVTIDHIGADLWRAEKLRRIAGEDIVRRHLRVCWENLNSRFNCCRCEKCIRTMCILETCGQLENYEIFGYGKGLTETIGQLPPLDSRIIHTYELFLEEGLTGKTHAAVRRWLERSRVAPTPMLRRTISWAGRKLSVVRR